MERSDGSDKMAVCKEVVCSLLMLLLGLLFCLSLATLVYCFCFQIIAEGTTSCTLWVDIPGRLAIFGTCYYLASICGFFPLPQRYHLNRVTEPFNVWRLESWRRLFRNMCFPTRRLINWLQIKAAPIWDGLETPLLQDNNEERFYDNSQRMRQSEAIDICYPKSYLVPVFVSNPEATPRNESPEVNKGSDGSITSMGSSVGVFADQITRGKSTNRYYTSEPSFAESPDDRARESSKYRKRYTEIKWPEEAAASVSLPMAHDHTIIPERPAMPTLDKKSKALTDDERLKIARQERLGLAFEVPQVHIIAPILLPRLSCDEIERILEAKFVPFTGDHKLVADGDPEIKLKHQMLNAHAAEERFRVPTPTAMTSNRPRMHGRIKQTEGRTVNHKIKPSPEYLEIYDEIKDARVGDDHTPVASEQSLADKYFAPAADERYATARQQEPTRYKFETPNLQAADGQIKVPTGKKLSTEKKFISTMHPRNRQPGGTTATNEQATQPKHRNTETRSNFPEIRDSQQPGGTTANSENVRNTARARSPVIPRFPWQHLKNPRGVSAGANKLHKKNLELEKRETERYSGRQRTPTSLDNLVGDLLDSLSSERRIITETQLPISIEKISFIAKSPFQMRDFSTKCSDVKSVRCKDLSSGIGKDKTDLTKNQYKLTEKHEVENMEKSQGLPLFSQRQYVERSNAAEATTRRRQFPSERSQVKMRSRLHSQDRAEERKLEIHRRDYQKDYEQKALFEAGPSNLSKFEQDAERTGILRPVTDENAYERFNRLELEGLRRRLVDFEHRTQTNTEVSATVESKQNIGTKREVRASGKSNEPNISTKPSEVMKSDVEISIHSSSSSGKSDNESGSEQ